MLFNSIEFAIFLPIIFALYWALKRDLKLQNLLLLAASYVFYGWWDWRFLSLIAFSSMVDYFVGLQMGKAEEQSRRKLLLWVSICVNLGFLGFFKYFNFFAESFSDAFTLLGTPIEATRLNIILPVGISFYTFQTLSYSIDIYRKKLEPTRDIIAFFAFVSFFPQLVAGPIERAKNLLPQFYIKRTFEQDKAIDGLRQILWGLFKKVVIADNCAEYVNIIFSNPSDYSGSTLFLGGVLFAFQIYGDFSGYSDMAIGTARLFGFNLMKNFAFPYFSRDIAEFWRRWHISLSTWFRDYLYIPLGGSRGGTWMKIKNTFIIFVVSGFWHGANWTFIFWGFLNALYFLPLLLSNKNRRNLETVAQGRLLPSLREFFSILLTFALTVLAWIFFRADNLTEAFGIIYRVFSLSIFTIPQYLPGGVLAMILFLLLVEWSNRDKEFGLQYFGSSSLKRNVLDYVLLSAVFWCIVIWRSGKELEFIYFQF